MYERRSEANLSSSTFTAADAVAGGGADGAGLAYKRAVSEGGAIGTFGSVASAALGTLSSAAGDAARGRSRSVLSRGAMGVAGGVAALGVAALGSAGISDGVAALGGAGISCSEERCRVPSRREAIWRKLASSSRARRAASWTLASIERPPFL